MNLSNATFTRVLSEAREGDEQAMNELLDVCREKLRLVARAGLDRVTRLRLDSDDVAQNGAMQVVRDFPTFRGDTLGEFNAWLQRIGLGHASRARRFHTAAKRDVRAETGAEADIVDEDDETTETEQLAELRAAIGKLCETDQFVVGAHVFDDVPLDQIAETLNCSPRHARRLFARALIRLGQLLGSDND